MSTPKRVPVNDPYLYIRVLGSYWNLLARLKPFIVVYLTAVALAPLVVLDDEDVLRMVEVRLLNLITDVVSTETNQKITLFSYSCPIFLNC